MVPIPNPNPTTDVPIPTPKIVKYTRSIPRKIRSRRRGITAKIIPATVVTTGFFLISVSIPAGETHGIVPVTAPEQISTIKVSQINRWLSK